MQASRDKIKSKIVGYCHRCGRSVDVGSSNVEKCADCQSMGFSID